MAVILQMVRGSIVEQANLSRMDYMGQKDKLIKVSLIIGR